ncbi:MAG: thrombospondin type 3 repeat-containing protein [Myxococcota bacterium]|nr:thrombospondin type 3 repeat-containing protein [Myxococcota bacterium]
MQKLKQTRFILKSVAALIIGLLSFAGAAQTARAQAQEAVGNIAFERLDLDFILKGIKISEDHSASNGGCDALLALLPNAHVPWGMRTVDGTCNNLIPGGETFGAADIEFMEAVAPSFIGAQVLTQPLSPNDVIGAETSYVRGDGRTVQDSTPRLISNLIVNQSIANPAALKALEDEEGEILGADIAGVPQIKIPNTAPDEGLSAPFNAYMTFFGQFFDHGLDLINKGGNGLVYMPLALDDPLYDKGADGVAGTDDDGHMNFQVLTRASRDAGPDGLIGTDDDVQAIVNATTNHVDQQQTYTGHSSAQILVRAYSFGPCPADNTPATPLAQGCVLSTGYLINNFGNDRIFGNADDGGMATWDAVQLQASSMLGFLLDDFDGANIPMFAADPYGKFLPGPQFGLPQLVIGENPDGTQMLIEGNLDLPVDASQAYRINHSFFIDVSHTANPGKFPGVGFAPEKAPDADNTINPRTDMLSGQRTRGIRTPGVPLPSGQVTYDDELLGYHFICGDGRCNENIALTTVHSIFHREHNRLVDITRRVILDQGDLGYLNEWTNSGSPATQAQLDAWGTGLAFPTSSASLANQEETTVAIEALGIDWNGERLFQAARFGTEMQYNRAVFDEFVPTLSGLKDGFEGYHTNINPGITAEFAQSVYRFGHSMLTETVDRYNPDFSTITDAGALDPITASEQLGLFEAFLNPTAFLNYDDDTQENTLTPEEAVGAVIRGITRTVGNEIDEFITGGMQNNLVGLALDIGALNIARGRDVGVPTLNAARRVFHAATQDASLTPYASWVDYGDNIRHAASLVNFIAAYGTHEMVAGADRIPGNSSAGEPLTVSDRRSAACTLVEAIALVPNYCADVGFGSLPIGPPADAADFLRSHGDWAPVGGLATSGIELVDFWPGGLAEERRPFTGYLGATMNFIFENQMEALQNGDRFYYLGRTATIPFFAGLESNSFTSLIMRNSDLGEFGGGVLPLGIFSVPNHYLEVDQSVQYTGNGIDGTEDPEPEEVFVALVIRDPNESSTNIFVPDPFRFLQYTGGDHVAIGGTMGNDTIIGGIGDDSLWGRQGNDRIEGGDGADHIEGGDGDDIITDLSGPDIIEGGAGNDAIHSGNEEDAIFGDAGSDFLINGSEFASMFGGPGNDFILDGTFLGHTRGGQGDDWIENLGGGEDLFQGDMGVAAEGGEPAHRGNDVLIAHAGNNDGDMESGDDIVVDGPGIERIEGQLGFDWASFQNDTFGVDVDLDLSVFLAPILPPSNATIQNRYDRVEGLSGSPMPDILNGTGNQVFGDDGNALVIVRDANGAIVHNGFTLIDGLNATGTAMALVPEVERKTQPDDTITGESQFGWAGGDIILGGGGSDLIEGEGGEDILDGDSSLAVNIETPDPAVRTGSASMAASVAGAAVSAAGSDQSYFTGQIAVGQANMEIAQINLDDVSANITTIEAAVLLAVGVAEAALVDADAAMDIAVAAATQAGINSAAFDSLVMSAEAEVAAATATLASEEAAVQGNNMAVLATQAAVVTAGTDLSDAQTALMSAQDALFMAETAAAAAANDSITALIALISCGGDTDPNCATESGAYDDSIQIVIAAQTAVATEETATSMATSLVTIREAGVDTAQTAFDAAVEMALNDSTLVSDAEDALAMAELQLGLKTTAAGMAADTLVDATMEAAAKAALRLSAMAALDMAEQAAGGISGLIAQAEADVMAAMVQVNAGVANLELADLAFDQAVAASAQAQAALPTNMNARILVAGMQQVQAAVFLGVINPGELAISRIIADRDVDNMDTDSVRYQGDFADYIIESDPITGVFADVHSRNAEAGTDGAGIDFAAGSINPTPDGLIEIIDTREIAVNLAARKTGNEGRDLVRNIERLIFDDITVILPEGAAGSAGAINSLAMGAVTVTPANGGAVGDTLMASLAGVTDADNVSLDNPTGAITGLTDYYWQIELEPGSGDFLDVTRLGGLNGNGDAFTPHGSEFVVSIEEAGLRLRVEALFLDDDGVFEIVRSTPVDVENCPGCPVPPGLGGIIPATFLGGPQDIANAIAAQDQLLSPLFENASRTGRPRLDVTITNIALDLFSNTGFGAEVLGGDEVLTSGFLLTFTDSEGNVTGTFAPEIVAITDIVTGLVDQDQVDLLFSIRGADVSGLVVPPYSVATLTVDGTVVANATLFGDSSLFDATGVAITLPNQSPIIGGAPSATFVGNAASIVEPIEFSNQTIGGGTPNFQFTIPTVDVSAFSDTGFGTLITPSESVAVGNGLTIRFEQAVAIAPADMVFTTGVIRPALFASLDENGDVIQGVVDVVFSASGAEAENLINGLTVLLIEANGFGVANEIDSELMFGDSLGEPESVVLLTTAAQLMAAQDVIDAHALGDPAGITAATDLLVAANLTAAADATQNQPGGPAAMLALSGLPHANYLGNLTDLNRPLVFENASRNQLPRLDFSIANMDLSLFANSGFGNPILGGDEILVDRISLMFTTQLGAVVGVFLPEIAALTDPVTSLVSQTQVNLLWSVRGVDVTPLVSGLTNVTVVLDGNPVNGIQLTGQSSLNDAQGVAEVTGATAVVAAQAVVNALVIGDTQNALVAQADLVFAMAAGLDSDGDGVADNNDVCAFDANNDADGDGVCGNVDNCPSTANADQSDMDSDGVGDVCDNCRYVANGTAIPDAGGHSQRDTDLDGFGNICDPDFNNDGLVNFADVAQLQMGWLQSDNPDLDLNGDGITNFGELSIISTYMFGQPDMAISQDR